MGPGGGAKVPVSAWDRRGTKGCSPVLDIPLEGGPEGHPHVWGAVWRQRTAPMSRAEEGNKELIEEVVTSVGLEQTTWASILVLPLTSNVTLGK